MKTQTTRGAIMPLALFATAIALTLTGFGIWATENAMPGGWVWIATGVVMIWPAIEIWKLR